MKNFIKSLISRLSPEVFKPVPEGLLYILLQVISREFSGECPWDKGDSCYKGYDSYWYFRCRNSLCPGYLHPLGLISYTSRSDTLTSVDNNFDYNTIRLGTSAIYNSEFHYEDDFVGVGTLGAMVRFYFGLGSPGGYGVDYYGWLYWNDNSQLGGITKVHIGDKWTITCTASTQVVGPAIPDPGNLGTYGPVDTKGTYRGDHDTIYTVELIDFLGYVPNFNDAILQICLSTCDGSWVDFWGDYFGIKRLLMLGGYESDDVYKARIIKEITRAKATKPILLEEAKKYFNSENVSIIEYCQVPDLSGHLWDGPNLGFDESGDPDPDRAGLQPFQFYIYPPTQRAPSSKFIVTGSNLKINGLGHTYTYIGGYAYYGYGYGDFEELENIAYGEFVGDWMFIPPASVGDSILFGNQYVFSGVYIDLLTPGIGGFYVWEYWNGDGWTEIDVSDTTLNFHNDGWVWWNLPGKTWIRADNVAYNIPNLGELWFWIRCRVIASPSLVPIVDLVELGYAGATNRGRYTGTYNIDLSRAKQPMNVTVNKGGVGYSADEVLTIVQPGGSGGTVTVVSVVSGEVEEILLTTSGVGYSVEDGLSTTGGGGTGCKINIRSSTYSKIGEYNYANRDENNCYAYRLGSWEKPLWESGLQEIIDKLKCAGTVCIINSKT